MKSLKKCPSCKVGFVKVQMNEAWFEEWCAHRHDCPIRYRQFYNKSYDEDTLKYITFRTKNFYYYAYFETGYFPNRTHIYHNVFPRGQQAQMPAFNIATIPIDFDALDQLDEKYRTLSLFI